MEVGKRCRAPGKSFGAVGGTVGGPGGGRRPIGTEAGWYSVSVKEYTVLVVVSFTGEIVLVKRLAEDLMEETKAAEERA